MNGYALPIAIGCLVIAATLFILSRRIQWSTGLPEGRVTYADTGAWRRNEKALFSASHRITGKPDYLVKDGDAIVPVEVKSGAAPATPRDGHILQLAAYCLLVEENLGRRPAMGIIQYADRQFAVDYTVALEQRLLEVVAEMRAAAREIEGPHRSHSEERRCMRCGVCENCDERLGI